MTAAHFASLLNARKVGRDKWMARCPSHDDNNPSLSIAVGKRTPIVMKCMSQGCEPTAILKAMGLSWSDVLEEKKITPAMRGRWADEKRLETLEFLAGWCPFHAFMDGRTAYWDEMERVLESRAKALRDKLYPEAAAERKRVEKVHRYIAKFGWDNLWEKWLATEAGKAAQAHCAKCGFTGFSTKPYDMDAEES
jgi:hypothetical protein